MTRQLLDEELCDYLGRWKPRSERRVEGIPDFAEIVKASAGWYAESRFNAEREPLEPALRKLEELDREKIPGTVAILPELIAMGCLLEGDELQRLRHTRYFAGTEEHTGIDKQGRFYEKGTPVYIVLHTHRLITAGMLQDKPDSNFSIIHGLEEEVDNFIDSPFPNGAEIPIITEEELIKDGVQRRLCAYISPLEKVSADQRLTREEFLSDTLTIMRNCGTQNLAGFYDRFAGEDGFFNFSLKRIRTPDSPYASTTVQIGYEEVPFSSAMLYVKSSFVQTGGGQCPHS